MEVLPALGAPASAARGAEASTGPEAEPQWQEGPASAEAACEWVEQGQSGACSDARPGRSWTPVPPDGEPASVRGRGSWSLIAQSPRP